MKVSTGDLLRTLGPTQIGSTSTVNSATSVLTLYDPDDVDESNYTCTGVNNVTNVLNTPEYDTGELYVQGNGRREREREERKREERDYRF